MKFIEGPELWFRSIVIVKRWPDEAERRVQEPGQARPERLDRPAPAVSVDAGSGCLERKTLRRWADVGLNHRLWFGLWFRGNLWLWLRLRLSPDFNRSWRGCCNSLLLGFQPCIGGLGPGKSLVFLADRLLRRRCLRCASSCSVGSLGWSSGGLWPTSEDRSDVLPTHPPVVQLNTIRLTQ